MIAGSIILSSSASPVVTGLQIAASNTATSANATTAPSLTGVAAGALLLISCASADSRTLATDVSVSSSPVLSWTKRAESDNAQGNSGMVEIWTAVFSAGGSITVTAAWQGGTTQASSSVCYAITGQEVTPSGATANDFNQTAPSLNITTTAANSIIFCVVSDFNAVAGTKTYRDSAVEVLDHDLSPTIYRGYHFYKQAPTATLYTEGLSAPTGQQSGIAAYEIRTA